MLKKTSYRKYVLSNLSTEQLISLNTAESLMAACARMLERCSVGSPAYVLDTPSVVEFFLELMDQAEYVPPCEADIQKAVDYAVIKLRGDCRSDDDIRQMHSTIAFWEAHECKKALYSQAFIIISDWEKFKSRVLGYRVFLCAITHENLILKKPSCLDVLQEKATKALKEIRAYELREKIDYTVR